MQVNIHFLHLFHYVAKYGGISQAARHVPYGIQQPALSSQIMELEDQVGTVLFQRRPFQLTPAGKKLYEHGKAYFEGLDKVTDELRNGAPDLVRIAASPVVLEEYLPDIFRNLQARFPRLNFTLRHGVHATIEQMLQLNEVDIAVSIREGKPPLHCSYESLIQLPLVLLVQKDSPLHSAQQLWAQDRILEKLIAPSPSDLLTRTFRQELARRSIYWNTVIHLDSVDLIETYAARGFGVGLSIGIPGRRRRDQLREIPLQGFPELDIGITWHRHPTPVTQALMAELRKKALELRRASPASGSAKSAVRSRVSSSGRSLPMSTRHHGAAVRAP
jgi:DNA-binding transcriptional LysR family regulator